MPRHNLLYWTGGDWWGIGPGAHSHVGGTRWWNVKHPAAYAARIAAGRSPAQAREVLAGPGAAAGADPAADAARHGLRRWLNWVHASRLAAADAVAGGLAAEAA